MACWCESMDSIFDQALENAGITEVADDNFPDFIKQLDALTDLQKQSADHTHH